MSPATERLLRTLVKLAKGAIHACEHWIDEQKNETEKAA